MTVRELIDELRTYPPELTVVKSALGDSGGIDEVIGLEVREVYSSDGLGFVGKAVQVKSFEG